MKILKEQETKLTSQLWSRIILILILWLVLATTEAYLFWQQYRRFSRPIPSSTIPDPSVDKATTLTNLFNQRLQIAPSQLTSPLEPFD